MEIRVGFGYDVHQLVEGRELWLGGVLIPHEKGALGHSDADVLLHAICDALFLTWMTPRINPMKSIGRLLRFYYLNALTTIAILHHDRIKTHD